MREHLRKTHRWEDQRIRDGIGGKGCGGGGRRERRGS